MGRRGTLAVVERRTRPEPTAFLPVRGEHRVMSMPDEGRGRQNVLYIAVVAALLVLLIAIVALVLT